MQTLDGGPRDRGPRILEEAQHVKMTRNQHWTEAQKLLGQVKDRNLSREEATEMLATAQVHATLAAAPREVVGE